MPHVFKVKFEVPNPDGPKQGKLIAADGLGEALTKLAQRVDPTFKQGHVHVNYVGFLDVTGVVEPTTPHKE